MWTDQHSETNDNRRGSYSESQPLLRPANMFIFRSCHNALLADLLCFAIFLFYSLLPRIEITDLFLLLLHPSSCLCRTVALTLGGLWSPVSRLAAAGAMATGLSATASVAMSTTTAARWGLRRRPICTRPHRLPSTLGSAERRSWCAP